MDYRDNRQRWAESHQVVHFYAGQWCTFTPALTLLPARAIAVTTTPSTNGERRWPGAVGQLEWGVENRANQRHRRGRVNAVRVAHALETRCFRDACGGLLGANLNVVPKDGKSMCHNALGQSRCAMWPVGRRTSRLQPFTARICVCVIQTGNHFSGTQCVNKENVHRGKPPPQENAVGANLMATVSSVRSKSAEPGRINPQ